MALPVSLPLEVLTDWGAHVLTPVVPPATPLILLPTRPAYLQLTVQQLGRVCSASGRTCSLTARALSVSGAGESGKSTIVKQMK